MKSNRIITRLAMLMVPLALLAAGAGVFWQGAGQPYPFSTLRGESVLVRGHGLYAYDTVNSSSQEIGQDIVTLVVGLPLLIVGIWLTRKASWRGRLLLTGVLGYFLYTYASMCFLTAFNAFFLIYVALFSLSLFAFILALSGLDAQEVMRHISDHFPRRTVAIYFIVVAVFLSLAWLGLVVPPMLNGTAPSGLESTTTMVIQALDLGVIVPTSLITAILLWRRQAWGYALSSVVLLKILTMGAALISMIIVQVLSGVPVDPVVSAVFAVISGVGIVLALMTLQNITEQSKLSAEWRL